jgi:hypothetical protein
MHTNVHDPNSAGRNFTHVPILGAMISGIRGALNALMIPRAFNEAPGERHKIAEVASDSVPERWYSIWTVGRPKAEGGRGRMWFCSYPSRQQPYKHLTRLWAREYDDDQERLTDYGALQLPARAAEQVSRAQLAEEMEARSLAARGAGRPVLYTIGHGSRELDGFVAQLRSVGVTLLVDVRTFPSSRWSKQFDKRRLCQPGALGADMRYRHMPELGGYNLDKSPRTKDDNWRAGIAWLGDRARRETLAIMCMERTPETCHRTQTIEPDLRRVAPDLEIIHLLQPRSGQAPTRPRQLGLLS